jgi:hypothetical protein
MTDILFHSSGPPGDGIFSKLLSKPDMGQLARFDTHWRRSSVAIVTSEYSLADLAHCRGPILDLTHPEFFGAAGFSPLHRISACCARAECYESATRIARRRPPTRSVVSTPCRSALGRWTRRRGVVIRGSVGVRCDTHEMG